MSAADADLVVRTMYAHSEFGGGRFAPQCGGAGKLAAEEILPNTIYRYREFETDSRGKPVHLTVYLGLGDVGGMLWEQEIRVLQRIGNIKHPALPEFIAGGHIPASGENEQPQRAGAGYVRTRAYQHVDTEDEIADYSDQLTKHFRANPVQALQNLWLIADALSLLHDSNVAHRNLWPGTLEHEIPEEHFVAMRLARFEMSSMVANLLRNERLDTVGVERVKHLYLSQDPRSLVYTPPERLEFLFDTQANALLSGTEGDVFALGMIAAEWLLEPEVLTEVPTRLRELRAVQAEVRRQIRISPTLPQGLRLLLDDMTDPTSDNRPKMAAVLQRLSACYDKALTALDPTEVTMPYLLVFMPNYANIGLRDLLSESATTDTGKEELAALVAQDLKGAKVAHSKTGAVPYMDEGVGRDEATTVLFGNDFIWFCSTYYRYKLGGRRYFDTVNVIRHPISKSRMSPKLETLRTTAPQRTLFAVEAVPMDIGDSKLEQMSTGRPSWRKLIDPLAGIGTETDSDSTEYLEALDLLLQYQTGTRYAREYAFTRERSGTQHGGESTLRWAREADTKRTDNLRNRLQVKIRQDGALRVSMGDFFAEADEDENSAKIMIEVRRDIGGKPGTRREDVVGSYRLIGVRSQDIITVDSYGLTDIPDSGWIRLADDFALYTVEQRQIAARDELEANRILLSQLMRPSGRAAPPDRWQGAEHRLLGEGGRAVQAMLTHEPMFALQGPPGSGKTEVTSEAVAAFLEEDHGARLLVSAQSHDALDNLAARILRKIGALDDNGEPQPCGFIAIRAGSDLTFHSVSDTMTKFAEDQVLLRLIADIDRHVTETINTGRAHEERLQRILRDWQGAIARSVIELTIRMRKGANLVFATTGASTRDRLVDQGTTEPFEWVLVEEAAKAWPTELAMPLVRGMRWCLIGDQAQIGAYGRQDVERFLDSCYNDPTPEIRTWWEKKERLLEAFDTFGHMFVAGDEAPPLMQLTEQRRMHSAIATVVSRAFYAARAAGELITVRDDVDHGVTEPPFLRGRPIVWIDTDPIEQAMGFWHNDSEAAIVAALVRALRPQPALTVNQRGASIAILTPYREQVQKLSGRVSEAATRVFTIDSFQGREADIVIASLVRDRPNPTGNTHKAIGHLADPARTNVLLSRARDLLILVGRLSLFESCDSPHWRTVTETIREVGTVVPLSETGLYR